MDEKKQSKNTDWKIYIKNEIISLRNRSKWMDE